MARGRPRQRRPRGVPGPRLRQTRGTSQPSERSDGPVHVPRGDGRRPADPGVTNLALLCRPLRSTCSCSGDIYSRPYSGSGTSQDKTPVALTQWLSGRLITVRARVDAWRRGTDESQAFVALLLLVGIAASFAVS